MLDETLTYALIKLMKAHRNQLAAALVPLGLHVGQELLLNQLWREDGLTQGELIARLGVEPPTVTKTLQRLERAGFVHRAPDPDRPRIGRVYLTDEGKALREPVEGIWTQLDEDLQRGFTAEERALLSRFLRAAPDFHC
ncbi:MarR family winged helix-turn-helix transcriptional regulator [Nonomuraea gerenzanensis]|uniref:Transcriptional regulator, MarR family n=1 Tax=Nonomuraea gerenzanensis TaxID=93944 RepID=A0A1M4DVE7_9ACTN|nr:MarR family transcriptional regulator [Nonomuraea gerenzanensis]UBU12866.1 MarR family transcriptional regulator [Nonomuraea gerenzanensis]SBO90521.1 Transcriptional regulator, MarR family [Nonomuraea gerenzanensis]